MPGSLRKEAIRPDAKLSFTAIMPSPLGKIGVTISENFLTQLQFLDDTYPLLTSKETLAGRIVEEVNHYFKNPSFQFTIPFRVTGTTFQTCAWKALVRLPVGSTTTYSALASDLNTGPRAVGNACRSNPIPLLIPCHRVLAKNGLGGFMGDCTGKKIAIKQWLLKHEAHLHS
jgi:methylated-DNA-[protein]-cysteine S-methyltransferase